MSRVSGLYSDAPKAQERGAWFAGWGRIVGAAALALVVAGCGAGRTPQGDAGGGIGADFGIDREQASRTVGRTVAVEPQGGRATIAVLVPLSASNGGVAQIGQSLANAAQLAAQDIGDPSLIVRVYDTAGTPAGAKAAATQAVSDGAAMIVGPLFGRSVAEVGPIAAEAGLPVIAFSTDVTVAGGNVFLGGVLIESEIDRMVGYASSQGVYTMGALAPSTKQGEVALRALQISADRHGVRLIATERYVQDFKGIEEGVRRFSETYAQIVGVTSGAPVDPTAPPVGVEAAPIPPAPTAPAPGIAAQTSVDAIFLADSGQALQSVGAYLAYYDVPPTDVKFMGPGIWATGSTLKESALRGGWFAAPDPGPRELFASRYSEAYGARPHRLAAVGYDALAAAGAMLADARSSGERFPFTVDAITAAAGFRGVNGVYRFRADGLNDRGLAILEVQETGFVVIDPAPSTFAGY